MTIHNGFATCTSTREIEAALDEIGTSSTAKAPKRIPVGITPKKGERVHRCFRHEAVRARKPFGEIDASYANGVKAQAAMQVYAETAYATESPEDELIEMIDRKHDSLGKILCAFADRAPRRVIRHA